MEKWVSLAEFLSDKPKLTPLFVDYQPDCKKVSFELERTGWNMDQITTTETNLGWYVIKGRGKTCYLISVQPTKFKLGLYGERGFRNGTNLIEEYTEMLYSCNDMKAKGISITESFFEKLPKHIKSLKDRYWIPERNYDSDDEKCIMR